MHALDQRPPRVSPPTLYRRRLCGGVGASLFWVCGISLWIALAAQMIGGQWEAWEGRCPLVGRLQRFSHLARSPRRPPVGDLVHPLNSTSRLLPKASFPFFFFFTPRLSADLFVVLGMSTFRARSGSVGKPTCTLRGKCLRFSTHVHPPVFTIPCTNCLEYYILFFYSPLYLGAKPTARCIFNI